MSIVFFVVVVVLASYFLVAGSTVVGEHRICVSLPGRSWPS